MHVNSALVIIKIVLDLETDSHGTVRDNLTLHRFCVAHPEISAHVVVALRSPTLPRACWFRGQHTWSLIPNIWHAVFINHTEILCEFRSQVGESALATLGVLRATDHVLRAEHWLERIDRGDANTRFEHCEGGEDVAATITAHKESEQVSSG